MTRHLLKLVWNRRRANTLIALEVFLSFLVLVAVVTLGVYLLDNYRQPLGYVYDDVWAIRVSMNVAEDPGAEVLPENSPASRRARLATLTGLVRDMPEVVSASTVNDPPYSYSGWGSGFEVGGRQFDYNANRASDDFATTMRLAVTRGRWFNATDDGAAWEPVVVNERFAREIFGGEDPVGRTIRPDPPKVGDGPPRPPSMKVVGVIADYRKGGEFSAPRNWMFFRGTLGPTNGGPDVPRNIVVRARPGTTAAFEARLVERLNATAPDLSFRARPLALARATVLRENLPQLAAGGLIASFLLTMVMLGLTGVLWLTVTQRTREVGLRRAKGATARDIQRQLRGEVAMLTSIAVVGGIVVVVQFPILSVFTTVAWPVYLSGVALSTVSIYALTIACAWAPSRLASSIEPAEALRWE